jgi:hypothetical protein
MGRESGGVVIAVFHDVHKLLVSSPVPLLVIPDPSTSINNEMKYAYMHTGSRNPYIAVLVRKLFFSFRENGMLGLVCTTNITGSLV